MRYAYICVLFTLIHKAPAEFIPVHAFMKRGNLRMHIHALSMSTRMNIMSSFSALSLFLRGSLFVIFAYSYIAWICTLTKKFYLWSISQLFVKCENDEKGSGWLMCEMCLMQRSSCSQLGAAYVSATTGAVVTALGLKSLASVMPVKTQ